MLEYIVRYFCHLPHHSLLISMRAFTWFLCSSRAISTPLADSLVVLLQGPVQLTVFRLSISPSYIDQALGGRLGQASFWRHPTLCPIQVMLWQI